jgi:hypothetical protein
MHTESAELERQAVTSGYEPRTKSLQAAVSASEKERVERYVRSRGLKSVSDWLYGLVIRELEAQASEQSAA